MKKLKFLLLTFLFISCLNSCFFLASFCADYGCMKTGEPKFSKKDPRGIYLVLYEKGYEKFSVMAKETVEMIKTPNSLRDDLIVFYFSHPDIIEDSGEIVGYKIKTSGKLIDSQINLEGLFTVVLYTNVEENKDGSFEYNIITNRYKKKPAKSPDGMFEEIKVPNNLQEVVNKIKEYYN